MTALTIGGIPFDETPRGIEGSPYWVDLWTDVNGYKIGLQVKPTSYKSASTSFYMRGAKHSEESGHKKFRHDFGGRVFIISPQNGYVPEHIVKEILEERDLLLRMPPK